MPSRKAAKVKKNEAAEKARKIEENFHALEQSQIQRLKNSNQSSVLATCMHGFDPFPDDHICIKFIRAFVHQFYKWFRKIYEAGTNAERVVIQCLLHTSETTQDEYSEVWNDAAKVKQVISYFLHNGTMLILADEKDVNALHSALFARFFEEWLKVKVHKSQACINWLKLNESAGWCDKHTLVKYFWRRIRCSCLDEAYEEVKSIPKMGICFNQQCAYPKRTVERSKIRCCSRCRSVNYCSRECQIADWSVHKELCDKVAAAKAEVYAGASQNQQS